MWRKTLAALALIAPLAVASSQGDAQGSGQPAPPHAFLYGVWTGGIFPATETEGPTCFGQATVIVTRDVIMRVSVLDVPYRQRLIETVAATADGVEFRLAPAGASIAPLGGRLPPDSAFGCANPNNLRVERRGANEIVFPNCGEFPSPLRRCTTPR